MTRIGLVVEGFGDRDAVPVLVRRRLHQRGEYRVQPAKALNAKGRGNLTKDGELERFVKQAFEPRVGAVLVVIDAEDDLPCQLGPALLGRAQKAAGGKPVRVCVAHRKFENWIAASDLGDPPWHPPAGYEGHGADAVIAAWTGGGAYVKTAMQAGFAQRLDMDLVAQRCPSFRRLLIRIDELCAAVRPAP